MALSSYHGLVTYDKRLLMHQCDIEPLIHCTGKWRFRSAQHRYVAASQPATALWVLRDIGNFAMNTPRCRQLPDETSSNTLATLQPLKSAACTYVAMNFMPALAICFQIANSCRRWRCSFQGISKDWSRADFSENLRDSLFNDDLSSEPNFSRIHLDGQNLYLYFL